MADYSDSKSGISGTYPEHVEDTSYQRLEPLMTATLLRTRFLSGLPLVSQMKDPLTGKAFVYTDEILADLIDGAVQTAELELAIDIMPVQHKEKHPFDRNAYEADGFLKLEHKPVTSIETLSVTPANGVDLLQLPLDWVETAYMPYGQINLLPMAGNLIYGGTLPTGVGSGAMFLHFLGQRSWIPAFWQVTYTSGFIDGLVPRVINDLVGVIAAMDVLSQLGVTYARTQSHSLNIDGLGQSVSTPGGQIFQVRLQELQARREKLEKKIKAMFGRKIYFGHV